MLQRPIGIRAQQSSTDAVFRLVPGPYPFSTNHSYIGTCFWVGLVLHRLVPGTHPLAQQTLPHVDLELWGSLLQKLCHTIGRNVAETY